MSSLDFVTAFRLARFEIRVLGLGVKMSPTSLLSLDQDLCLSFETYYRGLVNVIEGFHFLDSDQV